MTEPKNGAWRWLEKVAAGIALLCIGALATHLANAQVHQSQRVTDQNIRELSREVFREEVSDLKATIGALQGKIDTLLALKGGPK